MSNELENLESLFNPQVDMGGQPARASEEYKVSSEKGKGGIYQSVIRFIPYWKNPKNSLQEKWVSWLVDPVTQKGRFVDCPSSIGQPSLLQDMYWKLKKSESVIDQKKADIFSRRHNFGALIQVIKDDNQPELEGKIMYFSFGKKIWEKIDAELKPIIGDVHNPFDPLKGKAFTLIVTKVSGFNNYDQSKFVNTAIPICMPNEAGKLVPITENTDKQSVYEFLKTNSPDISKYGFKEWDAETKDYVNHVITAVTGQVTASSNYGDVNQSINPGNSIPGIKNPLQGLSDSGMASQGISIADINITDTPFGGVPSNLEMPSLPSIENMGIGNVDDLLSKL